MEKALDRYNIMNPLLNERLKASDFHLHTHYSDGSVDSSTLVKQAAKKKLTYISITDHNELSSYIPDLFMLTKSLNVYLLPGVEVDCGSGLDILIYDNSFNMLSDEFNHFIQSIMKIENNDRLDEAKKSLDKIKQYLTKGDIAPWILWNEKVDKRKVIAKLTVENVRRINLHNGKIDLPLRSYVSKPHIAKLFDSLGLINWDIFIKQNNIPLQKKDKRFKKFLFTEITRWKYDNNTINTTLLNKLTTSKFTTILAHPGKTFYDIYENNKNPTKDEFAQFVLDTINNYNLSGAECQYRAYHDYILDYNELTLNVLKEISDTSKKTIYGTAGSDKHHGFNVS